MIVEKNIRTIEEPVKNLTLGQMIDNVVELVPDNDALVMVDRDYKRTWRELSDSVDIIAKGLMAMGVQKGEKIAVWSTNIPNWIELMFASARIGAILLTVNTSYKIAEIEYLLKQSDTENLFIINGFRDTDYLETIYTLVPELKTQPRGSLNSEKFPHLKRVIFLGPQKHKGMYSMTEVMSLASVIKDEEYEERKASVDPDDVANMQYTSGTTGFPKGVMLTHNNIGNNGFWIGKNQNFTTDDRLCIPVPLFHCFGCVLAVMSSINHGVTMVLVEQYNPVDVMTSIEKERCSAVYGVPTMFIAMLDHPLFDKFDFSTLRTGIMAGSPCPVKTMNDVVEKMNMREITIVFGLTESSPGMTQTLYNEPSLEKKCSTVGKTMAGLEVAVLDPETKEPLPINTPGELCCRGYNVMKGYYKMPEATANCIDENGWLHSGDIGKMDEEGYFSITGRIKDMIIRGGENIYPKEVEDFIHHIDGVQDVQVVGVPSQKYGEQPGAFVILQKGVEMTAEDIQDYCRGKIAWHKIPKYVAIIETYPMTASGKIMKYKLRDMASELWPDA